MKPLAIARDAIISGSRFRVPAGALKSSSSNNIPDTRRVARNRHLAHGVRNAFFFT
jgi:hypothetical protein